MSATPRRSILHAAKPSQLPYNGKVNISPVILRTNQKILRKSPSIACVRNKPWFIGKNQALLAFRCVHLAGVPAGNKQLFDPVGPKSEHLKKLSSLLDCGSKSAHLQMELTLSA